MKMKKVIIFSLLIGFLCLESSPLLAQSKKIDTKKDVTPSLNKKDSISYNPQGRRDPFRDLLAGREVKEKGLVKGVPQMSINDVVLIGIVESKGKYTAIINGPQGFPFFIKVGDKFSDGFVLSIKESQVVFRKTRERGIPLMRPRDIVKEINPEER